MDVLIDKVTPTSVVFATSLLVYGLWKAFFTSSSLPDLPIIGHDEKQWFAWPRTLYRSYSNYRPLYRDAYDKYLSKGQACIMPEPNDTKVVLPSSMSQWLCDQPDKVLSAAMRQQDFLQTKHTFPTVKMAVHPYHESVIKRDLTRKLSTLSAEIWDELDESFKVYWGKDSQEWKEVNLMDTMIRVVTRTSNRLFVGKETCSNEKYLNLCTSFAQDVPIGGILIRMVPSFLRPILAPIITLPNRYHTWQLRSLLRPEIQRRLKLYGSEREVPNDFLQWFIAYARDNLEPEESTPKFIADRIATINFAAIHTSTFSIVNTIADIVTSPEKDFLIHTMSTEIKEVLAEDNGAWTKTSVQRLIKTDSILRESMRYSTFMTGAISRCVKVKDGITTPDGLHLKYGTVVEIPAWPKHLDNNVYPDAKKFIPLRFVESSSQKASAANEAANGKSKTVRNVSVVDTSYDFLNFSHGRHVCPGRFFAANELKLLLAYISLHYQVEPLMMEPKAIAFGSVMAPNPKLTVRIKRKISV